MGILFTRMLSSLFGNREASIMPEKLQSFIGFKWGKLCLRFQRLDLMWKLCSTTTLSFKSGISVSQVLLTSRNVLQESNVFIWPYWRCYFPNTQAIIYVVDSSDTDRLVTAKEEFHTILEEEELKGAVVLIYANKQDLPGALDDTAITEALELHKIKSRQWAIFKTSAIKGEGILEGLDWLSNTLRPGGG